MKYNNLKMTEHALNRFKERFSDVDLEQELNCVFNIGRKTRKKIKSSCPYNAKKYMTHKFAGIYYGRSRRTGIIFVIEKDQVITVFKLDEN